MTNLFVDVASYQNDSLDFFKNLAKQNIKGVVRIVIVVGRELFRVFAHENSFRVMETKAGKQQKQGDAYYVFEDSGIFHMVTVYHNVAGSPML